MFFHTDKEAIEVAGAKMRTLRLGSILPITDSTPGDNQMAEIAVKAYLEHLVRGSNIDKMVNCIRGGLDAYSAGATEQEAANFALNVDLLIQILAVANANPETGSLEVSLRKLFNSHPALQNGPTDTLIRVLALLLCTREVNPSQLEDAVNGHVDHHPV